MGRVWFVLYNAVLSVAGLALPFYSAFARARGVDAEEIRQRRGVPPPGMASTRLGRGRGPVWIQAASVGETRIALGLIQALSRRDPASNVVLTTTTRTGQALARSASGMGGRTAYCPLDFRRAVRRFLDELEPRALVLVETEIWPNLLAEASRRGIPVIVVNGRISDRALSRYLRIRPLVARALGCVDVVLAQTARDRDRFLRLGLPPERCRVTGNLKFSLAAAASRPEDLLRELGLGPLDELWVGGSTAEGEEEAVISAWGSLPEPAAGRRVLVLAPRRPERFESVSQLLERSGLTWRRRSSGAVEGGPGPRIILLDSIGELAALYTVATAAFVGGTLAPVGGHNLLEPAACGVAPVFGPHVENIPEVASRLLEAGGGFQARDARHLRDIFAALAADPPLRADAGRRARGVVAEGAEWLDDAAREILSRIPAHETEVR